MSGGRAAFSFCQPPVPTTLPVVSLPDSLAAGDSWRIRVAADGYAAADGWTGASLYLHGPQVLRLTGQQDADGWLFTAAPTATGTYAAGSYRAAVRLTGTSTAQTLSAGVLEVTPDVATAPPDAFLSEDERLIPLLETAIRRRVTCDVQAYTIGDRSATREDLREMRAMLAACRAKVDAQRNGGRLPSIAVQFGRAS